MSKLIATLVAGFISLGAFADTTPATPVAAPPATAKVAAEPAKDVYVVPAFFVVAARGIVIDTNDVREIFVERRINFRLQDVF